MPKLTAATARTSLGTPTAVLAIASATAAKSAGSHRIDVSGDQIVLLGGSHSRLGFRPSKEAKASRMRDRPTCGLLEELSTRLNDSFAQKFE